VRIFGGGDETAKLANTARHVLGLIGDPSPRAPRTLRALRWLIGLAGRRMLRFRLELVGGENLPGDAAGRAVGGWIAAGLPHVTWIEPFVMLVLLPVEPRLIWFGDGRVIERSWWRRFVFRRLGGVVPIWPGGGPRAFESHLEAVQQVVDAGAVFALFPEKGPPIPPGEARPLEPGLGYFGLRSGAPIVPIVFGGTHELFLGRRIRMVVLPPTTARELAGLAGDDPLPEPDSPGERDAARTMVEALHVRTVEAVAEAHRATEPPPGTRRHWSWLTHGFR
jgi:1-acyl-sn-glycerol-3-phosphate acyltransferase